MAGLIAEVDGETAPGFEGVREAFARNLAEHGEIGAAVAAYRHGEKIVDLWGGIADPETGRAWARDTLQVIFSTTKGVTATCALLLAERGELDLDAPVADYWPEFAANGKAHIPVRWLLTHQAGLVALDRPVTPAAAIAWEPMVTALAAQRPNWEPGTRVGYHAHTFGFLVGELVRRVSGRDIGRFLQEEIAGPLDLDLWIGLPDAERSRMSRIVMPPPDFSVFDQVDLDTLPTEMRDFVAAMANPASLVRRSMEIITPAFDHNRPEEWAAQLPSTNGIGTARALARCYAALIGEVDGHRILSPALLAEATKEQVDDVDTVLRTRIRYATGYGRSIPGAYFHRPSVFGFRGLGGSIGIADPDTGVAFGYVMNHIQEGTGDRTAATLYAAVQNALHS